MLGPHIAESTKSHEFLISHQGTRWIKVFGGVF